MEKEKSDEIRTLRRRKSGQESTENKFQVKEMLIETRGNLGSYK